MQKRTDLGTEYKKQGWADVELKSCCRPDERNLSKYA